MVETFKAQGIEYGLHQMLEDHLHRGVAQRAGDSQVDGAVREEGAGLGDQRLTNTVRGGCDDANWRVHGQSVTAMVEVTWMVNGLPPVRVL